MDEIRIPLGWGSLSAVVRGPANGKPVLLLHGWLDNAASFDPIAPLLPTEWKTMAIDLPGHGFSDHRPEGTCYHLSDAVLDIQRAVEAQGWTRYSIIGHSLGGAASSFLAATFPDHVEKVVTLEALGPLSSAASDTPKRLAELYSGISSLKGRRIPRYPNLETAVRARVLAGGISHQAADILTRRSVKPFEDGVTWRSDRRLLLPTPRYSEEQVLGFLAAIRCPILGVFADKGLLLGMRGWENRARQMKTFSWKEVSGQHHVHMENPGPVAKIISEWL